MHMSRYTLDLEFIFKFEKGYFTVQGRTNPSGFVQVLDSSFKKKRLIIYNTIIITLTLLFLLPHDDEQTVPVHQTNNSCSFTLTHYTTMWMQDKMTCDLRGDDFSGVSAE